MWSNAEEQKSNNRKNQMKDYYVTMKIQQGRLKAAMLELDIKTVVELSRRSGVAQSAISALLNFRASPRTKHGKWRVVTLTLCKVLGSEPCALFPEHLDHEITTNRIASFVEHMQLSDRATLCLGPGEEYQSAEINQALDVAFATLTPRERDVLKARFWEGKSSYAVGKEHGLTGAGIRVIERKALRKLRRSKHRDRLKEVYACV